MIRILKDGRRKLVVVCISPFGEKESTGGRDEIVVTAACLEVGLDFPRGTQWIAGDVFGDLGQRVLPGRRDLLLWDFIDQALAHRIAAFR